MPKQFAVMESLEADVREGLDGIRNRPAHTLLAEYQIACYEPTVGLRSAALRRLQIASAHPELKGWIERDPQVAKLVKSEV